jgi:hypothetical protein
LTELVLLRLLLSLGLRLLGSSLLLGEGWRGSLVSRWGARLWWYWSWFLRLFWTRREKSVNVDNILQKSPLLGELEEFQILGFFLGHL